MSETSTANPAARADEAAQPAHRDAAPTGDPVAAAVARWREDLTAAAGRDALVDYRDLATATLDLATAHPSGLAQFLAGRPTRLSNLFREPGALTAARKRARDIRLTAARLVDQHGVGGSYLASGMVRWRPDPLGDAVVAPVLLRPLNIRSRGAGQVDDDLDLEPEVRVNPALVRLLSEHGVRIDAAQIEALAAGEHGFNPRPALTALREAATDLPGFALTDRTVIGIFVDVVPALLADLDGAGPALGNHPVVRALATGVPLADAKNEPDDDTHAGGHVPSEVPFQVVDLDRDQRAVIEAVTKGQSVHVAAPPGSGATRMLTQLVVTEAGRGRRVLFVTSQRAEAAGVVEGLEAVGLAGLVSDPGDLLTGYRRRRGRGAEQVDALGDLSGPRPNPASATERLRTLAEQRLALHRVVERWGVSLSEALHALARLSSGPRAPRTTVRLGPDETAWLRGEERTAAAIMLRELADLGAFERGVGDSPWEGASLSTEQEAVAALVAAERLNAEGLPRLREEAVRAASAAGLASPATVAECGRQLKLLLAVRATLDVFTPAVYERSVADLIAATATSEWRESNDVRMSALERRRWKKQARDLLRPGSHPTDLHQALIRVQDERNQWQQLASVGGWPRVPTGLAETESAYESVRADCARLEAALPGADLQNLPLDELAATVERLARRDDLTTTLPARVAARAKLERLGLGKLLADLRERQVPAVRVVDELELCWWASVLEHLLSSPLGHQQLTSPVDVVRARQALYGATADAVRDADRARAASSCTVVSPLALPEMAPMGRRYDLVVLAAAHLCAVPEGVIAMARGSQLVVVGDPNGLPPVALDFNADETAAAAVEPDEQDQPRVSVLEATAAVLPKLALTHQHRMPSQLARLAAMPPAWSVPAAESVVRLEVVEDGTGRPDAEGGVESVDAEVRRVVDLVLEHARMRPGESLGVLAVTRHHARRIADAVRAELPEHPDVMDFFMRPKGEPFVVTDLPRCEDTVRDTVILSIGFGRTTRGRVLHRFGPLDSAGGEWALAVGATRARRRITVVSCFTADDLDPEKLRTPGAQALHRLLRAAAQPDVAEGGSAAGTGAKLDPMLDDLAKRLHDKGFEIEPGDHRPGWPDLAVRRGRSRPVAVMTDSRWLPGAVTSDVEAACELVDDDLSVAEHLRRFGWQVVSESSLDLFTDADAVVKAVQEAAGDHSPTAG